MAQKLEIRLSGSGGQGLVLAGVILAEAAVIYDGKNALQSQSYGPEARGGASKSEVIISDEDIDYPKAKGIDVCLALTQEACSKYYEDIKPGGLLLVDSDMVSEIPKGDFQVVQLPIINSAKEEVGKTITANIVALGVLVELTGVVTHEALEKAVLARVPKGTEELNKKALRVGQQLAASLKATA
jgi:2-oxoglutarate ferredoxin oxidoreductase subunit gamma